MGWANDWHEWPVYGLSQSDKEKRLLNGLVDLTNSHFQRCDPYRRILESQTQRIQIPTSTCEIPFLPVRIFKHLDLKSCPADEIVRILTSSGTTGQTPSRVFLDKETASNQTRALVKILQDFLGVQRLPMLVIDHPGAVSNKKSLSARGTGIRGLMTFGRDVTFALRDSDMAINLEVVQSFIEKHKDGPILLFGFTFMVWKEFLELLLARGVRLPIDKGILIHSGGWKKLSHLSIDNETLKRAAVETCGIRRVHNFYGMAEQVGSIFVECEAGVLHTPSFAEVIVRRSKDWTPAPIGKSGLLQVLSLLPQSYPGHSLLTEDLGEVVGIDDCPCGRLGKYFRVHGRLAAAEVRGCSDTMSGDASYAV